MSKLNSSIAFVLLVSIFLLSLLFASYQTKDLWIILFFIVLTTSTAITTIRLFNNQAFGTKLNEYPKAMLAVVIGALATFYLAKFGMSAVLASALIGIGGSLLFKRYEIEIFTGSFVGMSSIVFFNDGGILAASVISAVAYLMGKNVFVGIGGKLGSSAFIGTLLVAFLAGVDVVNFDNALINTSLPIWFIVIALIVSAIASIVTNQMAQRWFKGSTVLGSSVAGILGYLLSLSFGGLGGLFAGTIYAATFAGMSQNKVLKSPLFFAIAGSITAVIFLASSTYFLGLGGKMGTSAFIGVLATVIIIRKTK
jgi:hypothetical protein